ncbi:MAG: phytoene desaturase family protein [Methylococcaceae bacterium]
MTRKSTGRVLVIGAGLGGLSAAISLATEGFQVDLVEKNGHLGGKLNVLERNGFSFDLGPSILTMPHIFESLFTRAGRSMEDYLTIEPVTPHWRNFFEDGTVFDLWPDKLAMERELMRVFPKDVKGFFRFLEYAGTITSKVEQGYFYDGLDTLWEVVRHYGIWSSLTGFDIFNSMDQSVRKYIRDPRLVDTLNYFIKYVGSSPYDAPGLMNLLPHIQFAYGLWYVKGGMYNLARGLGQLAAELGVNVHLDTEITHLDSGGGRIERAHTGDGRVFNADLVVSNMEVIPAMKHLLKCSETELKPLEKFGPSCSGLVLHLGIDRQYPQLAHHNFLYAHDARQHFDSIFQKGVLSDDPTLYLVAPCKTDPAQAPNGCEIIKVLPHIPAINPDHPLTHEDYMAFRERVLDKLERMGLTDLRRHIVTEETWTPLDIEKLYRSNQGSIYGVITDRKSNRGFKIPHRSSHYRNLYFVGGSTNPGGGMPMVTLSGQLVRDKILKDRLRKS